MKIIDLKHKDEKLAKEELKKHSKLCATGSIDGVHKVVCRCDEKAKVKVDKKKVKKAIINEIDVNGNGRVTKKEIRNWINKKDDK